MVVFSLPTAHYIVVVIDEKFLLAPLSPEKKLGLVLSTNLSVCFVCITHLYFRFFLKEITQL